MKTSLASSTLLLTCVLLDHSPRAQTGQAQRSVSEVVKATVDSVVLIVVSDDTGKPVSEGSGFIASSDGKSPIITSSLALIRRL
jgi:hypothetical protein